MVEISTSEAFLFFGAALLGLSIGVVGNWFVTALFRVIDDSLVNKCPDQKRFYNVVILVIGIIIILVYILILWEIFEKIRILA